jgi:hypothetical protein
MTFIPESATKPFSHHFGYYTQPASVEPGSRIPLSASGFSMAGLAINANGQLEIDAGVTVFVQLGLLVERNDGNTYSISARWYNTNTSAYAGVAANQVVSSYAGLLLRVPTARLVIHAASATVIEAQVFTGTGAVSLTGAYPNTYHGRGWFSVTRYA